MRVGKARLHNFGIAMLLARLSGMLFIVFSTYNISGYSIWHWFLRRWADDWMMLLPIIVAYVIVYVLLVIQTYRSLGAAGIALALAFVGSIIWFLVDTRLVVLKDIGDVGVAVLYMTGSVLGIGIVWAAAWLTLTGQFSVDDLTR